MRANNAVHVRREKIKIALSGVLSCAGAIGISSLLFSLMITAADLPQGAVVLMSSVSLCAGCFSAAYSVSKRRRRKGMLTGVFCGIVIFFAAVFLGIIFVKAFTAAGVFTKLMMILVCSAIGGIVGVNSPAKFR
ncbi:MAG: TIGR04086 family membrane protein [Oscillospiraceae bacterium]|nr:TIGR04086 family membrane protein [Oscillospiraceae bacterium]